MIIAAFDIETIPHQDLPDAIGQFNPDSVKLGNLKDPEKIKAKIEEERAGHTKRMSLDPATAQACSFVGLIWNLDTNELVKKTAYQLSLKAADEHELGPYPIERYDVTWAAWDWLISAVNQKIPLVSFNGIGFDLPVLHFAAMAEDVPVPAGLYDKITSRYAAKDGVHYDLMQCLAGWQRDRWHSLDFYLQRFGLNSHKGEMDGSQVWPAFQAGEYQKILDYCEQDVKALCQLFDRVRHWIVGPKEGI